MFALRGQYLASRSCLLYWSFSCCVEILPRMSLLTFWKCHSRTST